MLALGLAPGCTGGGLVLGVGGLVAVFLVLCVALAAAALAWSTRSPKR